MVTFRHEHVRRLKESGGRSPQKCEVGGRLMHPSPNISRSTVIGCEAKYELSQVTKKGLQ